MAVLPTIAGTIRCTLNWNTLNGVTPRNVFHVRSASDEDAVIADDIGTALKSINLSHAFHPLPDGYNCSQIDLLRLDGSSATSTQVMPTITGGSGTGHDMPAGAALVSFRTSQRGTRGRGRLYMGPIAEAAQANGVVDATSRALSLAQWTAFLTGLPALPSASVLVVASYTHADAHDVLSLNVPLLIGTQRRRQDQLR